MNQNMTQSTRFNDLVDIRTVTVDKSLPKEERIADFGGTLCYADKKPIPFPLRRFCGKRLLRQKRRNPGELPARYSQVGDKLAFSAKSDTMNLEKDDT